MNALNIGNRAIGTGQPAFIVAEIGINHNGDLDLAKRSIEAAARAGADSVKFQNYRTETFVNDRALEYVYMNDGKEVRESTYAMFKRCELTREGLRALKGHCDEVGVIFHSTPTEAQGIRDLLDLDVALLKNGSDFLTNLPFIAELGATGLPVVLSTGMATREEIGDAVRTLREQGNDQIILLHCTSSYPAPPEDIHLPKMMALREAFGTAVGFSDHSAGTAASVGAVVLGACWIEKHFTLDKTLPGPDHHFSSDEAEFSDLVRSIRTVEAAMREAPIGPTQRELAGRREYRLSCVARTPLGRGAIVREEHITFRRPGSGVPPKAMASLIGRRLRRDIAPDHVFGDEDFE